MRFRPSSTRKMNSIATLQVPRRLLARCARHLPDRNPAGGSARHRTRTCGGRRGARAGLGHARRRAAASHRGARGSACPCSSPERLAFSPPLPSPCGRWRTRAAFRPRPCSARASRRFMAVPAVGNLAPSRSPWRSSQDWSSWPSRTPASPLWFLGGLVVSFVVLLGLARLIIMGARRMPRASSVIWRYAIGNLHRPGSAAGSVILALGLGLTLFVTLALTDRTISTELRSGIPEKAPAFFFLDVRNTELAGLQGRGERRRRASPMSTTRPCCAAAW